MSWSIDELRINYSLSNWGNFYFDISDSGELICRPDPDRPEKWISLDEIINVKFAMNQQPGKITLTLAMPGKFGKEISFIPPPRIYLSPFLSMANSRFSPEIDDLNRLDQGNQVACPPPP